MKKILISFVLISGMFSFILINSDVMAEKHCTMDVQCGSGQKCESGVCVGGIAPQIRGKCVTGSFGKKVCNNTGKECTNDSECMN